jgi:hypothetical protein
LEFVVDNYKEIQENPNNIFSQEVPIEDVALNGFRIADNPPEDCSGILFISFDVLSNVSTPVFEVIFLIKLVNINEYKIAKDLENRMPSRGLIDTYCPIMGCITYFINDKSEYYIYCTNLKNQEDKSLYTLTFNYMSVIKIMHIFAQVMVYNRLDYMIADIYRNININNINLIKLLFNNEFELMNYYLPPKKLLEKSNVAVVLVHIKNTINDFYIYSTVSINAKSRKYLNPKLNTDKIYELVDKKNSYIMNNSVNMIYIRSGADDISNKMFMIGYNREDLSNIICIESTQYNFNNFYKSILKGMSL